jgi:dihydroneopterin aldolase
MGKIYLKGMKIYAYHGCLKQENIIGGNFKINLMVKTNLKKASKSDRLKDTIDYSLLYEIIENEMKIKSFLIENVCERILDSLFNSFPYIIKASLEISKLNPPIDGDIKEIAVKKKRKRSLK